MQRAVIIHNPNNLSAATSFGSVISAFLKFPCIHLHINVARCVRRGSVFLCDVSHSGAAQSGGRASWDTKIGFVLLSPRSALTHSVLLPLVSAVVVVNKTFVARVRVRGLLHLTVCHARRQTHDKIELFINYHKHWLLHEVISQKVRPDFY